MAQKYYVTYDRKWIGANSYSDPEDEFNYLWSPSSFEQTSFVGTEGDKRLIGIVHLSDKHDKPSCIEKINRKFQAYTFTDVTPEEVVLLCNGWYPAPEGEEVYFTLDVDGFTIIDNRPNEVTLEMVE